MKQQSWQTCGHLKQKNILFRQLETGKFSHAYLFYGPENIGKYTLAKEFATKILNTANLESHLDHIFLEAKNEVGVEETREFMTKLSGKPFLGKFKVAIVNNAQNLNSNSQNALLKNLEEPSLSTILILVQNGGTMLKTIVSRCQKFSFSTCSDTELMQLSEQLQLSLEPKLLDLSFGKIGKLVSLYKNKDFQKNQLENMASFQELKTMPLGERILQIADWSKLEKTEIEEKLLFWTEFQTRELKNNVSEVKSLKALTQALLDLRNNLNKKLILQNLFIEI